MNQKNKKSFGVFLIFLFAGLVLSGCSFSRLVNHYKGPPEGMVLIPGDTFLLGSDRDGPEPDLLAGIDELPKHTTYVRSFYMDRYEVTEAQYLEFLRATGSKKYPGYWMEAGMTDRYPAGYGKHPVSDVDWFDATEYCRWAGKRLPNEIEWEKAARGTDGRIWPWGDHFIAGYANTRDVSPRWASPKGQESFPIKGWKAPGGSYPEDRSPYGVYDMAGNVQEWTASSYSTYPGNPVRTVKENKQYRILRGGSYLAKAEFSRTAVRTAVMPTIGASEEDGWHSDYTYGFRCAKN